MGRTRCTAPQYDGRMALRMILVAALCIVPAASETLRGRVITDDGNPLPGATEIALKCGDELVATRVDSEGAFAIEAGEGSADCSLSVEAPGYRQVGDSVQKLPRDPRIPAFVLHRLDRNQGESISVSHLAAPQEAIRHYHSAFRMMSRPQADADAILTHLGEAQRIYPGFAQAWFESGRLQLALGRPDEAVQAFRNALNADPWYVSPYQPLMLLLRAQGDSAAASEACQGLRRINPELPTDCAE